MKGFQSSTDRFLRELITVSRHSHYDFPLSHDVSYLDDVLKSHVSAVGVLELLSNGVVHALKT